MSGPLGVRKGGNHNGLENKERFRQPVRRRRHDELGRKGRENVPTD